MSSKLIVAMTYKIYNSRLMLYTWNLHSAACQWYLNKAGGGGEKRRPGSTLNSSGKPFWVGFITSSPVIQQHFVPSHVTAFIRSAFHSFIPSAEVLWTRPCGKQRSTRQGRCPLAWSRFWEINSNPQVLESLAILLSWALMEMGQGPRAHTHSGDLT